MTASENGTIEAGKAASRTFDRAEFVEAFGSCVRGGSVVAGRAFDSAPTANDSVSVFNALRTAFRAASDAEKLEMLKAYTPLDPGTRAARIVEDESQSDSLRAMTAGQQSRLLELLAAYREKFGFDVIFVVRNYTTATLLASLETRFNDDVPTELETTYREIELLAEILVKAHFDAAQ